MAGKYSPINTDDLALTESLTAPDPEEVAKPASSSVSVGNRCGTLLDAGFFHTGRISSRQRLTVHPPHLISLVDF